MVEKISNNSNFQGKSLIKICKIISLKGPCFNLRLKFFQVEKNKIKNICDRKCLITCLREGVHTSSFISRGNLYNSTLNKLKSSLYLVFLFVITSFMPYARYFNQSWSPFLVLGRSYRSLKS